MSNKGAEKPVDKRNEEKQCPYCERIFKQLDRFNQHVVKCAKKHPDAAGSSAQDQEQQDHVQQGDVAGKSIDMKSAGIESSSASRSNGAAQPNSSAGDSDARGGTAETRYMQKTPKMLLMELIQKLKKHSKPKYYPGAWHRWMRKLPRE